MVNFRILAERVVALNGDLRCGWPTHCELWKDPKVQNMIQYFSMHTGNLHGCALGLSSSADGKPTKKPWTIATTSCNMHSAFERAPCPGTRAHLDHAQCAGAETRRTEEGVHRPFRRPRPRGNPIKTVTGDWAVFNDIGSVPSTMTAARIALACSAVMPGSQTLQCDCIRAYIQALMDPPDSVNTYVELPTAWWPTGWLKMRRPVIKLLQALYGHPRAGNLWHAKLDKILIKISTSTKRGRPCTS